MRRISGMKLLTTQRDHDHEYDSRKADFFNGSVFKAGLFHHTYIYLNAKRFLQFRRSDLRQNIVLA